MSALSPLVSVIVPVYNVEQFLVKCIDSILCQTYRNLEIILIDDGSTDSCPEICNEYAGKDLRIFVIHKSNEGQAIARNIGLDNCNGEYICFVDSDDWLENTAIEYMVAIAQRERADLVIAERRHVRADGESSFTPYQLLEGESILRLTDVQAINLFAEKNWAPWARLYRKSLYKDIRFPNYKIFEDEAIMFQLLKNSQTIAYTNKIVYNYNVRDGSTTKQCYTKKKIDGVRAWDNNLEYLKENYPVAVKLVVNKMVQICIYNLDNLIQLEEKDDLDYVLRVLKKYYWACLKDRRVRLTLKVRTALACKCLNLYKKLYLRRK